MSRQPVIDGLEFASAGARLHGTWPLAEFARVRDMLVSDAGELAYVVQGVRDEHGRLALALSLRGTLVLRCQRCLEPMEHLLKVEEELVLAATQAELDAEPTHANAPNRVLAGREMPVHDLIEDELILAVPYAPRHERCIDLAPGEGEGAGASPFANLRGMLRGKN